MQYKLINPSDPYTFLASSHEAAALTVFVLSTNFGAESEEGETVPIFLFGGSEEWYIENFGRTVEEGIDALRPEIAESLCSFMLGDFEDRKRYELALSLIDDESKKEKFKEEWQEAHSSYSNIGAFAHQTGLKLKEKLNKEN